MEKAKMGHISKVGSGYTCYMIYVLNSTIKDIKYDPETFHTEDEALKAYSREVEIAMGNTRDDAKIELEYILVSGPSKTIEKSVMFQVENNK